MSENDNSENDFQNSKENEEDENSEVDEDRPTLFQINRKIDKLKKEENMKTLLKKRLRADKKSDIIFDANKKKLINCFCPNEDELNNFLEHCEIREIKDEKELIELNISNENMFDPNEFIQKNCKKEERKSLISIEDIASIVKREKIYNPEYLKFEEESYIPKPIIEDKTDLIKGILSNEILNFNQKEELNNLLLKIKNIHIKNIIKNDKLNIVFDLDNTCILGFSITQNEYQSLTKEFPHKKLKLIIFNYNKKTMLFCLEIRKGLLEFFKFVKPFCNFYISTLGIESYGAEIQLILENMMGIKFLKMKGRKDQKESKKLLKDLKLEIKNTVIFDDKPDVWIKDSLNVIISKKFIDREFEDYFRNKNNISDLSNFLFQYFPFYFYKSSKDKYNQIKWKEQKLRGGRQCPFYKFLKKNDAKNNDCYSGEYLDSSNLQFIYMKNIIKIIYYLVFNYDIHVRDALKLIRYNIFHKEYFCLNFYKGEGKDILIDIIENCGGKIYIENNENNINDDIIDKIFIICRKEDYQKQEDRIKKELFIKKNSKIVTEKFILDSFYFLTNLEDEIDNPEYFINNDNNDEYSNY